MILINTSGITSLFYAYVASQSQQAYILALNLYLIIDNKTTGDFLEYEPLDFELALVLQKQMPISL